MLNRPLKQVYRYKSYDTNSRILQLQKYINYFAQTEKNPKIHNRSFLSFTK